MSHIFSFVPCLEFCHVSSNLQFTEINTLIIVIILIILAFLIILIMNQNHYTTFKSMYFFDINNFYLYALFFALMTYLSKINGIFGLKHFIIWQKSTFWILTFLLKFHSIFGRRAIIFLVPPPYY